MTQPVPGGSAPDAAYAPAPPQRGATARVLTTLGGVLGLAAIGVGALFLVDLMMSETATTHRTYDAVGTVELVADGDVTVTAAEGDVEVDAVARSGLRDPRYAADESADRLEITHRCDWTAFLPRCSGSLEVTLPAATEVVVVTENGDVVASGLAGELSVRSSNGRIEVADIGGAVVARSSNGDVTVRNAGSDVEASSSNGEVSVDEVDGSVTSESSNGRITVGTVAGDAWARTSNGSVEISAVEGNVYGETSNGRITVVGDGEPVALTVQTSNGDQVVEGPTDPDADRTVEMRSSNGDVAYLVP
ncbi:DUF4097 family beta strand repeat-containing protein [Promicromonospora sp. NPDC052451]|uniref:DUF4097 family beta strand repeat-containing protein n=1 Tax=Promicromonospora sp. NPDC052451 TaxID=3364407 RepID=UPI0037C7C3A0